MFTSSVFAQNTTIDNFGTAKSILNKIFSKGYKTIYCNCEFQKKSVKLNTCKILTKKYKKRSKRLEWEHIVPAHAFGQSFSEWRQSEKVCKSKKLKNGKIKKISGRKCAAKKNIQFRMMEADLYNLYPSVGAINALRSNFSMSDGIDKKNELCQNGLRLEKRKVSPPLDKKGDIARVYQYMDAVYPGKGVISNKNKKLFESWSLLDPVSESECQDYYLKKKYQKSVNPILDEPCKKLIMAK